MKKAIENTIFNSRLGEKKGTFCKHKLRQFNGFARARGSVCTLSVSMWQQLSTTQHERVNLKLVVIHYHRHHANFQVPETMWAHGIFLTLFTLSLLLGQSCCETDTLLQGQYLKDGQELVSAFNIFKLKFFNFKNTSNLYLGIWYNSLYLNDIQDRAVWIANRNNPIPGRPGSLTVDSLGRLKILRGASSLLDLSSTETSRNTTLKLLDSGNLQLQEMDSDGSMRRVLWQSFDYPTDTLLPGMKLGYSAKTGMRWELTSWLGDTLPASGSFVFGMDANITNLLTILWRGNMYWASGLWFKGQFSLEAFNNYKSVFSFVSNESEHYFMFSVDGHYSETVFPSITIDQQGVLHINRLDREQARVRCSPFTLSEEAILMDWYGRNRSDWYRENSSDCYGNKTRDCLQAGCIVPDMPYGFLNCSPYRSNYFKKRVSAFPGHGSVLNETGGRHSSADCQAICLQNCFCLAYASTNVDGTGCEIWNDPCQIGNTDSTNNRSSSPSPRTIYIHEQSTECVEIDSRKETSYSVVNREKGNAVIWLVVVASVFLIILVTCLVTYLVLRKFKLKVTDVFRGTFYFLWGKITQQSKAAFYFLRGEIIPPIKAAFYFLWRKIIPQMIGVIRRRLQTLKYGSTIDRELLLRELGIDRRDRHRRSSRKNNNELHIYSFESVALATDYFSDENKLGEGGFGPVYKAWNLFKENQIRKMMDPSLGDSAHENPQVLRCVQVALLCVQENAEDRPSMLDVVSMIYGDGNNALSLPKEPAFYGGLRGSSPEMEVEPAEQENVTENRVTITVMEARNQLSDSWVHFLIMSQEIFAKQVAVVQWFCSSKRIGFHSVCFVAAAAYSGQSCCETDTLLQGEYLKDGQELVSAFNIFKLKFFNFKNSSNLYLGIWYNNLYLKDIQDRAVWIANRNSPIPGRHGSLTIDSLGRLKILRGASSLLDLSSTETSRNTTLRLLDSGNLQLQEMDPDGSVRRVLWQSFDYPTDTLLPGMKLGYSVKTGKRWELTSWLGDTLPASGSFVFGMDANITNLLTILWRGNMYWASGLWFKGQFSLQGFNNYEPVFSFVSNESEHYFMFSVDRHYSETVFPTIMIDQQGILHIYRVDGERAHVRCSPFTFDEQRYDRYEQGNYDRYERKIGDGLQAGCVAPDMTFQNCLPNQLISKRTFQLSQAMDYFKETVSAFPGNGFLLNETGGRLSSADCHAICLQNCSCLAYASTNVDGTGCEIWYTDPTNKKSSSHNPRTIYIRVKEAVVDEKNEKAATWLVVVASLFLILPVTWFIIYLVLRKFKVKVTVIFRRMFNYLWRKVIPQSKAQLTNFCISMRLQTLKDGSTIDREILLRELGIDRRGRHRRKNRIREVIDASLGDSALENPQVLRCVQVALLCVQENAEDRPSMLDVVSMIYGDGNNALSLPKEPAFYDGPRRSSPEMEVEPLEPENVTENSVTITVMEAR
ncbi:unnamed protein product [Thlaspi arvense]|uniref:non-specific serine/threonine protein kinase n=1 Tax=Thlaspi arvense TaxID=13288 RepID=A0AAU9S3M2_THLAR|nr:unnamed protein product [Thlaspi arvense]